MYDHRWEAKFQELHTLVETHVASEENEIFGEIEAVMTPQEAEELGVTVETAKQASSRGGTPSKIPDRVLPIAQDIPPLQGREFW